MLFILNAGVRRAVDLCAAPGSWSQVLSRKLSRKRFDFLLAALDFPTIWNIIKMPTRDAKVSQLANPKPLSTEGATSPDAANMGGTSIEHGRYTIPLSSRIHLSAATTTPSRHPQFNAHIQPPLSPLASSLLQYTLRHPVLTYTAL